MNNTQMQSIEIIEFNEAQKAAMAAALMAVADEIPGPTTNKKVKKEKKKKPPLRVGDIIELSDSDDDDDSNASSDCEITGFVSLDNNQPIAAYVKLAPPVVKVEIKEELVQLPYPEVDQQTMAEVSQDDFLLNGVAQEPVEQIQDAKEANDCMPQPLQIWQKEEHPLDMGEDIVVEEYTTSTHETPVIRSVLTLAHPSISNILNKSYGDTLLEPLDHQNTNETHSEGAANTKGIAEDNNAPTSEEICDQLYIAGDEAATFSIDQFADEELENLDGDEGESMDNYMDDDVIVLEDSDDDDDNMDEETEKKLIELIESDSDEDATATNTETTERNISNLIHLLCPECGLSCGSLRKWRGHLEAEHTFSDISKINMQTIINKEGDLCHQCKTCHQKFQRNAQFGKLFQHCLTHMPFSDYFKCRLCVKRLSSRTRMRYHLMHEHYKICKHYVGKPVRDMKNSNVCFSCPVCGKKQKSRTNWETHLEDVHDYKATIEEKTKQSTTPGRWECQKCSKEFDARQRKAHLFLHEPHKPFSCKEVDCSFEGTSLNVMRHHIRSKHFTGKLLHLCMFCDDKFETNLLRLRHMRDKHPKRRSMCHVCHKKFASPALLLSHMNATNHQKLK